MGEAIPPKASAEEQLAQMIADHSFRLLFIEGLGWESVRGELTVEVDGGVFSLQLLAHKRGFQVFHCPINRLSIINRGRLRAIQSKVARSAHEHILIFTSDAPSRQVWQWAVRLPDGRRVRHREHPFFSAQPPPALRKRLLSMRFSLGEEESATLSDAVERVRMALDTIPELNLFAKRPRVAERSDALAQAVKRGEAGALDRFIEFHLPLARKSSQMLGRWFGMDAEDAQQIATLGLIEAARRFKPELGYQFSTYASYWIRQLCQRDGVATGLPIRIPEHAFWPCYRLQFSYQKLLATWGKTEGDWRMLQLLEETGVHPSHWRAFEAAYGQVVFSDLERCDFDQIVSIPDRRPGPLARVLEEERREKVHRSLGRLRSRHADVIKMRYGFQQQELTLEEVGATLSITRERVRQIQDSAESVLAYFLRNDAPEGSAVKEINEEGAAGGGL